MKVSESDLRLEDGRTLHVYDTGGDGPVVVWHHGTPNTGAPPAPLFAAAEALGVRWVSYDRPGYGGSSPLPDRTVASAAADVRPVTDALGVGRFTVLGHSGGGPHALACAALLGDRVLGAATVAGLAPYDAEGLDWYAGMVPSSAASLRAAAEGRAAKEAYEAGATYDPDMFTDADHEALASTWSWFDEVVGPALEGGPDAPITDDLAYVAPWGFDPATIAAPLLLVHGEEDRIAPAAHSRWLAERCPTAELRLRPGAGHISVLEAGAEALEWLVARRG
ncbi:alpha/beta fold hydrolase [Streptomyces sp. CAI-155]|uniref:alpha/beta fold hydrolase n=1 Tax=Streptomyces sp. CAI-155 TaxID=1472660 RepID=UPI0015871EDD|nr:alpha/beta hydrolase [Streptomyces sp. CAI-155]NUV82857.1 alpha/beta hydrolase [Streptomyces sp. CAI-155]